MIDYIEQYGDPGIQFQHHVCIKCTQMVQQDPFYLKEHLATHDLTLASYTQLLEGHGNALKGGEHSVTQEYLNESSSGHFNNFSSIEANPEGISFSDSVLQLGNENDEDTNDSTKISDIVNIKTEPDINLGYFDDNEPDTSNVSDSDLETAIHPNIIRDLTVSTDTFFKSQVMQSQKNLAYQNSSFGNVAWYQGCLYQCAIPNCGRQYYEEDNN